MSIPPLAALRAFEAVARHLSFTRAAEELGMTQAAVSYQIRMLEERMGAPLFLRKPREVVLTETENGGRFHITVPTKPGLLTRIRRFFTWPFAIRAAPANRGRCTVS